MLNDDVEYIVCARIGFTVVVFFCTAVTRGDFRTWVSGSAPVGPSSSGCNRT